MTSYTTSKAAELAHRLAEKEAEKQQELDAIRAEQEAENAVLDNALEKAGRARVALVEDLLDMFDIEPAASEPRKNKRTGEILRDRDGAPKTTDPDPDETLRMQRLFAAINEIATSPQVDPVENRSNQHPEHPSLDEDYEDIHGAMDAS